MDSDLYPNDGAAFEAPADFQPTIPQERIEAEARDNGILAASYPIMGQIADWFLEEAQNAMDIANIDLQSKVPVEAQVQAFQLYQSKMIEKAKEFERFRTEQS